MFDLAPLRARLTRAGAPEAALEAWFGRMLHAAATLTLVGEFRLFRELASSTLGSVLEQLDGEVGRVDEVLQVSASSTRIPTLQRRSDGSREQRSGSQR